MSQEHLVLNQKSPQENRIALFEAIDNSATKEKRVLVTQSFKQFLPIFELQDQIEALEFSKNNTPQDESYDFNLSQIEAVRQQLIEVQLQMYSALDIDPTNPQDNFEYATYLRAMREIDYKYFRTIPPNSEDIAEN